MPFPLHIFIELFGQICAADVATEFMGTNEAVVGKKDF